MPCSRCFDKGLSCKMLDGVNRCKNCNDANLTSCDGNHVPIDSLNNIISEHQRLQTRRHEVSAELQQTNLRAQELLSRLLRLDRQVEFLREKGVKMAQRGFQNMDELDAQERLEEEQNRLEEEQAKLSSVIAPSGMD
ncbi:hypothetical protein GGR55DRAFT_281830 [Xylaria sp. FL0064]|nr:hypothetical protein GGR55DRAFT_281830 [Xylaria sp. FL0064]